MSPFELFFGRQSNYNLYPMNESDECEREHDDIDNDTDTKSSDESAVEVHSL